jgi:hypothetical protein
MLEWIEKNVNRRLRFTDVPIVKDEGACICDEAKSSTLCSLPPIAPTMERRSRQAGKNVRLSSFTRSNLNVNGSYRVIALAPKNLKQKLLDRGPEPTHKGIKDQRHKSAKRQFDFRPWQRLQRPTQLLLGPTCSSKQALYVQ